MQELGIDKCELGLLLDESQTVINGILSGQQTITSDLAERLARALGASQEFWFARERQYREALSRRENGDWLEALPYREMVKAGWLVDARDRLSQCLSFFGVSSVQEWKRAYRPVLSGSLLRVSPTTRISEPALAAWLHQATLLAAAEKVGIFDRSALAAKVDTIRTLTRQSDPQRFVPTLRATLASVGVALVTLPTISGSPVNGAARILDNGSAMLAISGRYLADDQLWFTVFHEVAHLILHSSADLFLDDFSTDAASDSREEQEANEFASSTLLPTDVRSAIPTGTISYRDAIRIANVAGVSPGVVVGQLQFDGRIKHDQLNRAKRRYRWDGPILRSA